MTTEQPVQAPPRPRKRRRVFMWTFLVIQALLLIWIVAAIATAHPAPSAAAVAAACGNGGWQGVFQSYQDCTVHFANGLTQASEAGTAIGVGLVVVLWVAVDVILGVGRVVVLTSRRRADR